MRIFKRRPSPALIVAIAALSVSLVGTAVAVPIADISLTKKEKKQTRKISRNIANRVSNRVSNRRITQRAPLLSVANAQNASNADELGGEGPDSYAPSEAEPVRIVGQPGEPPFQGTWGVGGVEQVPGFWKDPFGTVHLQGHAGRTGADDTIFTLPPGYRPTDSSYFSVYPSSGSGDMAIQVLANGEVNLFYLEEPTDDNFVGLNEISFRAAGS